MKEIDPEYLRRLEKRINELKNEKTIKKIVCSQDNSEYLIVCYQANELNNPDGRMKWNGWEVVGKIYSMHLYKDFDRAKLKGIGFPIKSYIDTDKNEANKHYLEIIERVKKEL